MVRLFASKRGITEELLNIVMLVVVALAVISITLCIFVIGRSMPSDTPEDSDPVADFPSSESTDPSVEFPEDSTTVTDEPESDTVAITDTDTDTEPSSESDKPTEPPTESETEPTAPPMPESFVPVTPDNVSVISANAIYSDHAILVECSTNKVLAQRLADYRIYPASMTKIMTIIVACEQIKDLDARLTIPSAIITQCRAEGASVAGFTAGQSVTARDMLYGAALPSGADATFGLAMLVTGKTDIFEAESEFAKLMNQKAKDLGMTKTTFVNASGLHNDNHASTVRDVATMMNYAMHVPLVKQILSTVQYTTSYGKTLTSSVFSKTSYAHQTYSNGVTMVAGKSGFTYHAMYCLASYHEAENGKGYVLVTALSYQNSYQPISDAKYIVENYIK
ncbi:MAG: hypothetical protein IKA82_03755 [Clostridia bacterium]|nr:hypothetical protein [Clostridia bacterium]